MNTEQAKALRAPFPPEAIGKLPKGGVQLDYVGHAATTDRLLQVDPEWNWRPMSLDERGLPALDADGNLWILLTVAGVERPGVGDGRNMKERIGDAIRNAAMRFGVALDLWAKEDLHGDAVQQERTGAGKPPRPRREPVPATPKTPKEAGNGDRHPLYDELTTLLGDKLTLEQQTALEAHRTTRRGCRRRSTRSNRQRSRCPRRRGWRRDSVPGRPLGLRPAPRVAGVVGRRGQARAGRAEP